MANRSCYAMVKIQDADVEKFRVQAGQTFYPGDIVKLETLDTGLSNNIEVYSPTPCASVTADRFCIIPNQRFEQLTDGRRPTGNPDVSTYTFTAGQTIEVIRLRKNYTFFISDDCLDNKGSVAPAVAVKLIPRVGDYQLATDATGGSSITVLNIEKRESQPSGGQFGASFIDGNIARVTEGY